MQPPSITETSIGLSFRHSSVRVLLAKELVSFAAVLVLVYDVFCFDFAVCLEVTVEVANRWKR